MSRKKDIEALIKRAEKDFLKIEKEYGTALETKEITAELQIDIKELLSNLRSTLDYIAHDVFEKYCQTAVKKAKINFPIRTDRESFKLLMDKAFPGLIESCKEAYDIMESTQAF